MTKVTRMDNSLQGTTSWHITANSSLHRTRTAALLCSEFSGSRRAVRAAELGTLARLRETLEVSFAAVEHFEIIGEIREIETIGVGHGIRDLAILEKHFGKGNWRKLKGFATVRLEDGAVTEAEVHWYEAHGIGKRWIKIKRYSKSR